MSVYEFNMLSLAEKSAAMVEATFLMDNKTEDYHTMLYNLDNFYVEIYFDEPTRQIKYINGYRSTMYLNSYLNCVEL